MKEFLFRFALDEQVEINRYFHNQSIHPVFKLIGMKLANLEMKLILNPLSMYFLQSEFSTFKKRLSRVE